MMLHTTKEKNVVFIIHSHINFHIMKKGLLVGLAALAVGAVVMSLGGKKSKPNNSNFYPGSMSK